MANILEKPKLFIPVLVSSGISGLLAAYAKMTPGAASILLLTVLYVVYPVALGFLMKWIFIDRTHFASVEDLWIAV